MPNNHTPSKLSDTDTTILNNSVGLKHVNSFPEKDLSETIPSLSLNSLIAVKCLDISRSSTQIVTL